MKFAMIGERSKVGQSIINFAKQNIDNLLYIYKLYDILSYIY